MISRNSNYTYRDVVIAIGGKRKAVKGAIRNDLQIQFTKATPIATYNNIVFTIKIVKKVKELKKLVHTMIDEEGYWRSGRRTRIHSALKIQECLKDNVQNIQLLYIILGIPMTSN